MCEQYPRILHLKFGRGSFREVLGKLKIMKLLCVWWMLLMAMIEAIISADQTMDLLRVFFYDRVINIFLQDVWHRLVHPALGEVEPSK